MIQLKRGSAHADVLDRVLTDMAGITVTALGFMQFCTTLCERSSDCRPLPSLLFPPYRARCHHYPQRPQKQLPQPLAMTSSHVTAHDAVLTAVPAVLTIQDQMLITVLNNLNVGSSIHWHGFSFSTDSNDMDGIPFVHQPLIPPGESKVYNFTANSVGTLDASYPANRLRDPRTRIGQHVRIGLLLHQRRMQAIAGYSKLATSPSHECRSAHFCFACPSAIRCVVKSHVQLALLVSERRLSTQLGPCAGDRAPSLALRCDN